MTGVARRISFLFFLNGLSSVHTECQQTGKNVPKTRDLHLSTYAETNRAYSDSLGFNSDGKG